MYNAHDIVASGSNMKNGVYDLAEYSKPYTIMTYWDKTNDTGTLTPPSVTTADWDQKLDCRYTFHDP